MINMAQIWLKIGVVAKSPNTIDSTIPNWDWF